MDQSPLSNNQKASNPPPRPQDLFDFQVICRVRPLQSPQIASDIMVNQEKPTITIIEQAKNSSKEFTFNKIYKENTTQTQFTQELADSIFNNSLVNGKGSLVLSYGVTNSGKTYTILGTEEEPGLLPIIIERALKEFPNESLRITAIQSYNDQFYSLEDKKRLLPKELYGTYQFDDYQPQSINPQKIKEMMNLYMKNRSQSDTKANKNSSRSHAIFKVDCQSISVAIVDLAGSERLNKVSSNIQETTSINTSLLVLGRCLHSFRDHNVVPYRESKLTKALAEFFTNQYKIYMIAHINRSGEMFHQNLNVLQYAAVSMTIKHFNAQMNRSILKSARQRSALPKSYLKNKEGEQDASNVKNSEVNKTGQRKNKLLKEQEDPLDKLIKEDLHRKKRIAMERYVSQMIARMDDFDFYLDSQFAKQDKKDRQLIQEMRNARYISPQKEKKVNKQMVQAETRIKIRRQILEEIEKEKNQNITEAGTSMGPSMKKCLEESIRRNPPVQQEEQKESQVEEDLSTPIKIQEKGENENFLQRILSMSKTAMSKTHRVIEKVVEGLRDLSKKKSKRKSPQRRQPNLSIRNQEVNQMFEQKKPPSEQQQNSVNNFLHLLDEVDKTSNASSDEQSLLLDSFRNSRQCSIEESGSTKNNKDKITLKEIRESQEFTADKKSPFFNGSSQSKETVANQVEVKYKEQSTFDDTASLATTENGNSRPGKSKPRTKKPMKFIVEPKVSLPTRSPVRTRSQVGKLRIK